MTLVALGWDRLGLGLWGPRAFGPLVLCVAAGWAAALLGLLVVVFFHELVLEGKTFVAPDTLAPAGFVRIGEQSLFKDHVYPLWNPFVFLGMPSFASGAYNPYIYPPDWPVGVLQRFLPLPDMTWLLLYYFLAGLFTFLLVAAVTVVLWRRRMSWWMGALAGVLMAFATLVRSTGLPLLLVVLLCMLIRRVGWRAIAAAMVGAAIPILIYMSWFDEVHGRFALTNTDNVHGFVIEAGGRTSHTAILAKSLGIPAVGRYPESLAVFGLYEGGGVCPAGEVHIDDYQRQVTG